MFDWREYVELASGLGGASTGGTISVQVSEATGRSAVSRAYYGAFCHARNYAQVNLGFAPTYRGADHWLVRQHLSRHGHPDLARRLLQLHDWRKRCDYEDTVPNLAPMVLIALREAAAVIQAL